MAAGDPDIGTGTILTFAGFTAELLSLAWDGIERGAIDFSHMGTTGAQIFKPPDLYDPGEITAEVHFKASELPPITGTLATLQIAFPEGSFWTITAPGAGDDGAFLTGFTLQDPMEDKMVATAVFKVSGEIVVT